MKPVKYLQRVLRRDSRHQVRRGGLALGVFLYVFCGLNTAMADDIDIYLKAAAVGGGSPLVGLVVDTSAEMNYDIVNSTNATATTLLHQRSYNMMDGMRAVVTSVGGNVRFSLTDFYSKKESETLPTDTIDPDNGRIVLPAVKMSDVASTTALGGFTSPIDKAISNGNNDVEQTTAGVVRYAETSLTANVVPAPKLSSLAGSWVLSGGSVAPAAYTGAPANGNPVVYYKQESGTSQTFTLNSPTVDTVLYLVRDSDGVLIATNNDIDGTLYCSVGQLGDATVSRPLTNHCYLKVTGKWVDQGAALKTNPNSTISLATLTVGTVYRLVIATNTAAQTGTWTVALGAAANGELATALPFGSGDQLQKIGLYFGKLNIPRGASINKAELQYKVVGGVKADVEAGVEDVDTAVDFTVTPVQSRVIAKEMGGTMAAGLPLDVKDLVAFAVGNGNWCPGNAIAVIIRSKSGVATDPSIDIASFEGGNAPVLHIEYDTSSGNQSACTQRTITKQIGAMSEDVNEFADGTTDLSLPMPPTGATTDATTENKRGRLHLNNTGKVGLRFTLVDIPNDAKILSARLQLTPIGTVASPQPITITSLLDKTGLVTAFTDVPKSISTRAIGSSVTFTPANWVDHQLVWSSDITTLVKEQVNRGVWQYEGTMGFMLSGGASEMLACGWEYGPGGGINSLNQSDFGQCAAKLEITFDDGGKAPVTTYRKVLVDKLMSLKKEGIQPVSAAYVKTAEYFGNYFTKIAADNVTVALGEHADIDTNKVDPQLNAGECAANAIAMVSADHEDADYNPNNLATDLAAFTTAIGVPDSCTISGGTKGFTCATAAAAALYNGFTPVGYTGKYKVDTYTVNFGPRAQGGGGVLNAIVQKAGGGANYFSANSSTSLATNLLAVIRSIADTGASVAAPGVSVNALNRFEHLDQLYYSLFTPSTNVNWTGNLKRYQLLNSAVSDVNGVNAVDLTTSFFKFDAQSFWSDKVDGSVVTVGGAASESIAADRELYTYLGDNAAASSTTLTESINIGNGNIGISEVGVDRLAAYPTMTPANAEGRRTAVIDWLRATPHDNTDVLWGAAIHASPRIVTFDTADPTRPIITVFYGDNRGFIHAIDAGELTSDTPSVNLANTGGKELFGFIPQELLKNAALLDDRDSGKVTVASNGYVYGMDGDLTTRRVDSNHDGNLDKVLLYAGMRRGGDNYYVLDVTNARSDVAVGSRAPKLEYVIDGGVGDYSNMGQTWSAMSLNKIKLNGTSRDVVFFTGGYDAARHDKNLPFQNVDQLGHVIYMIDADTGELLWKSDTLDTTKFPAMTSMRYSMTATPRTLDRNADGLVDGMYVVDLAGQVFRLDFDSANTGASNLVKNVVLVAKFGATASGADPTIDNRRFYDSPSVAYVRTASGSADVLLALSSGYREEPTSKITKEAFVFFKDVGAFSATPQINATLDLTSLVNITGLTSTNDTTKPGWYFYFDQTIGEKGIGSPVIFNQAILFGAYVTQPAVAICSPDIGTTRLYLVDFLGAGLLKDGTDAGTTPDRWTDIGLPGLADTPQIIFREGGGLDVAVGVKVSDATSLCDSTVHCPFDSSIFGKMRRSRWYVVDEE